MGIDHRTAPLEEAAVLGDTGVDGIEDCAPLRPDDGEDSVAIVSRPCEARRTAREGVPTLYAEVVVAVVRGFSRPRPFQAYRRGHPP